MHPAMLSLVMSTGYVPLPCALAFGRAAALLKPVSKKQSHEYGASRRERLLTHKLRPVIPGIRAAKPQVSPAVVRATGWILESRSVCSGQPESRRNERPQGRTETRYQFASHSSCG